nr:abortive infection family protein [uncultured Duganella sp.]
MRQIIPAPVLSVVAEVCAARETHATLDGLFMYADAPGDPPDGSKPAKALEWLRRTNKDANADPLAVLGKLIEGYMDAPPNQWDDGSDKQKIEKALEHSGLQYIRGGRITSATSTASSSRTLEQLLKTFDYSAVDDEFARALAKVQTEPREAVSAASNILESFCKLYIAENGLDMPTKQDLKPLWTVVRKHLGFDPAAVADTDLQTILSGLIAIVEGIGALRTHASSAHGAGVTSYRLEPRHARLAIHSAHTVTLFALETWQKRRK